MYIFLVTLIAFVATFLLNPIFKKANKTIDKKRSFKFHLHHSVLGIVMLITGLIIGSETFVAAGLGIYLAHGFEEMYFNKRSPVKAFFIFVTR